MEDLNDLDKGEEAGQDATNEVVVKSYEDVLYPEGVLITISCIMGILLLLFIIVCCLWCHNRRLLLRQEAKMLKAGVTRKSLDSIPSAAKPSFRDIICQDPDLSDDFVQLQSQIQRESTAHRGTHRYSEIPMGVYDNRGTHRYSEIQPFTKQYRETWPGTSTAESISPTNGRRSSIVYFDSSPVNTLEQPQHHSSLKEPYMNYHVNSNNSPHSHSTGVSRNKRSPQEYLRTPETTKHDESRKFSLDSPFIATKNSKFQNAREHLGSIELQASPQNVDSANSVISENKTASHNKPTESGRESFDAGLMMKKDVPYLSFQNKKSSEHDYKMVVQALRDYWRKKDLAELQAWSLKGHEGGRPKFFTMRSKTCSPNTCQSRIDNSATSRQLRFQKASSVPWGSKCHISRDIPRCSSPKPCRCLIDNSTAKSLQKTFSTPTPDSPKCDQCSALSSKSSTYRGEKTLKMTTTDSPCSCTICENASRRRSPEFDRRLINESPIQVTSDVSPSTHYLPSKSSSSLSSPSLIHMCVKMDTTLTSSVSESSECLVDTSPTRRVSSLLRAFSHSTVLPDSSERSSPEFRNRQRKFHKR